MLQIVGISIVALVLLVVGPHLAFSYSYNRTNVVDKPIILDQLKVLNFAQTRYQGPVDVVITWLNSSDPDWQKSFESFGYAFEPDRFVTSKELELNLVTMSAFIPSVRNVFIVTLKQDDIELDFLPQNFKKKIRFIMHEQIIDRKYLPLFNSNAIEANLWKIPGLSEIFIYCNDDMMFARPFDMARIVNGSSDGAIVIPSSHRTYYGNADRLNLNSTDEPHTIQYYNTINVFFGHYGYFVPYTSHAHSPFILSKTLLNVTSQIFPQHFDQLNRNRVRSYARADASPSGGDVLFLYLSLYVGHHYYKVHFVGKGKGYIFYFQFTCTDLIFFCHKNNISVDMLLFFNFVSFYILKDAFSTVLLSNDHADSITKTMINTFENQNADFITVQELYKISELQFGIVCGHIVKAACNASNTPSCDDLEYVRHNVCANRESKLMLKVRDLWSYHWLKNENINRNSNKILIRDSQIPTIADMHKYHPLTSPKSTSELMKELNYVFTAYESGSFQEKSQSSALNKYSIQSYHEKNENSSPTIPMGVRKLQVTFFNAERGTFWLKQCEMLKNNPALNGSDIIFFNELDIGMARSGNLDTASMLANCTSMNYVYAVEFIEFSLGIRREIKQVNLGKYPISDKKNLVGYHGNAIMSKFPLTNIELVSLDGSQEFWRKGGPNKEYRIGARQAIFASISLDALRSYPGSHAATGQDKDKDTINNSIDLACTHLDARIGEAYNTLSIKTVAKILKRRNAKGGAIVAGDLGSPGLRESAAANYLFANESFRSPWTTNRVVRALDPKPRGDWIMVSGGTMEPIPGSVDIIDSQKLSNHNFITVHLKLNGI